MPIVIEEMPIHFQNAEKAAKGKKHVSQYTTDELKSGAMARMSKFDALPPEIRALVWEWGYISVINAGRQIYPCAKWEPIFWEAKKVLKELSIARAMRRVEDDKILGIHKGLETGTVIDMF